jgi:hypothetical protein
MNSRRARILRIHRKSCVNLEGVANCKDCLGPLLLLPSRCFYKLGLFDGPFG